MEGLITCIYASVNSLPLIICALHKEYTPHDARYAAPHAAVSVSDTIPNVKERRDLLKRAWPLYGPSLTGCMLVASLFFGCPEVSGTLVWPVVDGPSLATMGTKPLPPSMASWYGRRWQGRLTASGERFDRHQPTTAHRTAPIGTHVVVTNLANGPVVRVQITDRGPYTRQRACDFSYEAARRLDTVCMGTARVKVEFLAASPPFV